jgi:hypothetical protein
MAIYKHSSLFGLIDSDGGKKLYKIDTRMSRPIDSATICLFLKEAVVHSGHKVLVEVEDHGTLVIGDFTLSFNKVDSKKFILKLINSEDRQNIYTLNPKCLN